MIAIGWVVYAVVYAGFAFSRALPALLGVVPRLRLLLRLRRRRRRRRSSPISRPRRGAARRSASTTPCIGLGALAASVVFGVVWTAFGAPAAFGVGAALALVATALLFVVVAADTMHDRPRMRRILVTNDDGYRSEGIEALADALAPLGEVTIVAPTTEASAIGHALTLRRPLRLEHIARSRVRASTARRPTA